MSYFLRGKLGVRPGHADVVPVVPVHNVSGGREIDRRSPKVIVGVSLTLPSEPTLPAHVLTFPAVMDTGYNRVLEIDEWHLFHWAGYHRGLFPGFQLNVPRFRDGRRHEKRYAGLWLHQTHYTGRWAHAGLSPLKLAKDTFIRVMLNDPFDAKPAPPSPRFPLLGVEALVANGLKLTIDGGAETFEIEGR